MSFKIIKKSFVTRWIASKDFLKNTDPHEFEISQMNGDEFNDLRFKHTVKGLDSVGGVHIHNLSREAFPKYLHGWRGLTFTNGEPFEYNKANVEVFISQAPADYLWGIVNEMVNRAEWQEFTEGYEKN